MIKNQNLIFNINFNYNCLLYSVVISMLLGVFYSKLLYNINNCLYINPITFSIKFSNIKLSFIIMSFM